MELNRFYVYVHIRHDTGMPFYVGKGKGMRCGKTQGRNPYWKNVVAKSGGFDSLKIYEGLSEQDAFSKEIQTIKSLRLRDIRLVNLSEGGEGNSGWNHTDKAKLKMSVAHKGHKYNVGHKHTEETKQKMSKAKTGRPMGESQRIGLRKARLKTNVYAFEHSTIGVFVGTQNEFGRINYVSQSKISMLVNGKRKTSNGWSCKEL